MGESGAFQVLAGLREVSLPGESFGREWNWQARLAPKCCLPDPWWYPVGIGHSSLEQNPVLAAQMVAKLGTGRCLATVALWDGTTALVSAGPAVRGHVVRPRSEMHQPFLAWFGASQPKPG